MPEKLEFTSEHSTQYKALSDDMRFYADQRFKIITAYLLTSGLIANVIKDRPSILLCLSGAALALLCFCWEQASARWWGTLMTQCQAIEDIAIPRDQMVAAYERYSDQIPKNRIQRLAILRPSVVVALIYAMSFVEWLIGGWFA